jgi:putative ABC transport system substrate-binding protein
MVVRLGLLVLLSWLAAPPAADAQQPVDKVYQLGFLASGGATASASLVEAFRNGLRDLGWVEGKNIVIDYRFAEGRFDRLPGLADELVRKKVDLILAVPTPAAVAAKNAAGAIPIVMAAVANPVGLGLIASLARPGGNITGTSYSFDLDIFAKQLQLLKEAVPTTRRVAILSNPASPSQALVVSNVKAAARTLGLSLQLLEARSPDEFDGAFAAMAKDRAEALLVVSDSLYGTYAVQIAELATVPTIDSRARASKKPEDSLVWAKHCAVSRLPCTWTRFSRAPSRELPAQPTRFDLVVNLRTRRCSATIPPSLLLRADQVISDLVLPNPVFIGLPAEAQSHAEPPSCCELTRCGHGHGLSPQWLTCEDLSWQLSLWRGQVRGRPRSDSEHLPLQLLHLQANALLGRRGKGGWLPFVDGSGGAHPVSVQHQEEPPLLLPALWRTRLWRRTRNAHWKDVRDQSGMPGRRY